MSDNNSQKTSRLAILKRDKPWVLWLIGGLFAAFVIGGFIYVDVSGKRVYIEKSDIEATSISLSPSMPGILEALYVHEGDVLPPNTLVARVGNELIKTKTTALVLSVSNKTGAQVNPGEAVVIVIDPSSLRVVGQVDEDKGLASLTVGERALFTVDAFGGKEYSGVVDEVSPTSRVSGIAFSISDKRETRAFNVKVRFDINAYPELKNGMSAKLWIYKENNKNTAN